MVWTMEGWIILKYMYNMHVYQALQLNCFYIMNHNLLQKNGKSNVNRVILIIIRREVDGV